MHDCVAEIACGEQTEHAVLAGIQVLRAGIDAVRKGLRRPCSDTEVSSRGMMKAITSMFFTMEMKKGSRNKVNVRAPVKKINVNRVERLFDPNSLDDGASARPQSRANSRLPKMPKFINAEKNK